MTKRKASGLGRCDAVRASMLKALMARGTPQDVSAWLVGVNGGRANDVMHGRVFSEVPPANDNELRNYLSEVVARFNEAALRI